MPEAEELLTDAARHATIAAQSLWKRWRGERPATPCWLLADYRQRVELLADVVLGVRLPVRAAQPPAPESWVARLLRGRHWRAQPFAAQPLPANDGVAIYLPPAIDIAHDAQGAENRRDYPALALLQGVRVVRGSAHCFRACGTPLEADLYLLAEAAAADRELRRLLPGWSGTLQALYARAAALPRHAGPPGSLEREVQALYRTLLQPDRIASPPSSAPSVPALPTPQDALAWAADTARTLSARCARQPYRQRLADFVVGRLLPPEGKPVALPGRAAATEQAAEPRRATMARRPRARDSEEGEDDAQPGVWMIQTSDPHEHAEDPFGLNRPQDRDLDSDAQGMAESLSELESARLVSTPGRAAETLVSDTPPPRADRDAAHAEPGAAFAYPEWDCRIGGYRAQAVHVHVAPAAAGPAAWVEQALRRHAATLRDMRRRLGAIRPHRQILKRQADGDDIDTDALVDERSDRRAGGTPAGALYQQQRPAPRRIGLLLLIDASASTDAWVADAQRVIDVEKEAALVAACALDMVRAEFAMLSFSGEGPHGVQMRRIKDFGEPWSGEIMRRIAVIEPDRYTRLGGAVRHASALLARRAVDARLLLLFSDGKPNDCDLYAGAYGLDDARQALIEARVQQIDPYCFTIDREASAYLPHLFGAGHYTIVQRAQQLPLAFVDWLRNAARRSWR